MGFEPMIPFSRYAHLANECLQPLGHVSTRSICLTMPWPASRDRQMVIKSAPLHIIINVQDKDSDGGLRRILEQGRTADSLQKWPHGIASFDS